MTALDDTHDARRESFVASANGHADFPIQNLPVGIFSRKNETPRGGVAIGEKILDLRDATDAGLFDGVAANAAKAACSETLNDLLAMGRPVRQALRTQLFALLDAKSGNQGAVAATLHDASTCTMHLPVQIGDYTDFYAGINHAVNSGKVFRPDNPLLPNYKHIPIGYHGRASSIRVSGTPVMRPRGQIKGPGDETPRFGLTERLDIELELGVWIGPGNALGSPVGIGEAADHIAGFCLLNDWSARDIQAWEYQPLGPFLAKNFLSSISPWIVTPEALAPFRIAQAPRPAGDPAPLPYLVDAGDQASGAFDLGLEISLLTPAMRAKGMAPKILSRGNARELYWTVAQFVAHHTSGGCNLNAGDLFGTGTISGTTPDTLGCLQEMTQGGKTPIALDDGETRSFLQDGDEIVLRARARRDGFASIGFGECRGVVSGNAG